jgi:amino-acid N-acetyltransferase
VWAVSASNATARPACCARRPSPTHTAVGGTAAVRALEARAHDAGVETLYLLTTTAAAFFAELGYERIERESVPAPIRESAEFGELCPSSATVMRRRL